MQLDINPIRDRLDKITFHWVPTVGEKGGPAGQMHSLIDGQGKLLALVPILSNAQFFANSRADIYSLLQEVARLRGMQAKAAPLLALMEGQSQQMLRSLSEMPSSEISRLMDKLEQCLRACNNQLELRGAFHKPEEPS